MDGVEGGVERVVWWIGGVVYREEWRGMVWRKE